MAKDTRSNRIRVIDQGACHLENCSFYYPGIPHRHGLAVIDGLASLELIASAEQTLRRLGYVGETEIEVLPREYFSAVYRTYGA